MAWRDDTDKVRIQQALPTTSVGAATGAFSGPLWGTLLGLLFLNPLAGLAVCGLTGAAAGALTDIGISDDLIRRIGEQLQPGKAAVFVLIRRSTPDRVTEALKCYQPTVLHTNLTTQPEEDLVKARLQP